jgi:hypothetical protein
MRHGSNRVSKRAVNARGNAEIIHEFESENGRFNLADFIAPGRISNLALERRLGLLPRRRHGPALFDFCHRFTGDLIINPAGRKYRHF